MRLRKGPRALVDVQQSRDLGPERLAVLEVGRGAVPNIQAVEGQELVVSGE